MLKTRTRYLLIVSALSALSAIGVFTSMLFWLSREGRELNEQVAVIASSAAYQEEYSKLTMFLAETEPKRAELAQYVLSEGDIIHFLAELEQAGRSFGLAIETKELTEIPLAEGAAFPTLKVEIGFKGGASDSKRFLMLLEALPYASRIDAFSFTELGIPGQSGGVAGAVTLIVQVS